VVLIVATWFAVAGFAHSNGPFSSLDMRMAKQGAVIGTILGILIVLSDWRHSRSSCGYGDDHDNGDAGEPPNKRM
jgi:hypothetical protein